MDRLPTTSHDVWKDLFHAANHHVTHGVVAANNSQRNRIWRHWCNFVQPTFDPLLQGLDRNEQVTLLQAFMEWVRQGRIGRGTQVKAGSVQDALGAIGKTFELAGLPNPTYKPGTDRLDARLQRQLEALRRSDPPTRPQLAVPVSVPHWVFDQSRLSRSPHVQAVGDLCLIAFYFLLRVGEYTQTQATRTTRTQQFRLQDVVFFRQQQPMTNADLCNPNLQPDLVRLRIDNQKNGKRNQIISHHASNQRYCPVNACANRVRTLLNAGATPETPLCAYRPYPEAPFAYVTNDDIVDAVRAALGPTGTTDRGYRDKIVGSHSLRAGGAMALFNQGVEVTKIMKMGRWTSTAFMTYIHEQVDVVSRGIAEKMATAIPFVNLDTSPPESAYQPAHSQDTGTSNAV